jgi:hypothetical protein
MLKTIKWSRSQTMNADQLAKFKEEITAKVNDKGAGLDDIAAIVDN